MNRSALVLSLLVLSFLGIADAWYLAQHALSGTALACDLAGALDGCNVVANSAYSRLFGLPLALYGVGFYGALFVLAAALPFMPSRKLYRTLKIFGIVGLAASLVFLFIQFVLIKALCVYCIASAVIAALICATALALWKRFAPLPALPVVGS